MTRFVFLPTITHTGTFFVAAFLLKHPDIKGYFQVNTLAAILDEDEKVVHHVLGATPLKGGEPFITERFVYGRVNIIQDHIWCFPNYYMATLMTVLPTIIPLRDPLLTILSANERIKDREIRDKRDLVKAWKALVSIINSISGTTKLAFFPIDQAADKRSGILRETLEYLQLPSLLPYVSDWAKEWPKCYNTGGQYEGKIAYETGDIAWIKSSLGHYWEALQEAESHLRPFLEQHGYKNLLWWT